MTTYDRKYYLIRVVKEKGFELVHDKNDRTVMIPQSRKREAERLKQLHELQNKYQYGVQYTIE